MKSSSALAANPSLSLKKERLTLATLMAAVVFAIYTFCAAPTVTYGGDCGELISASYRLGIAHPTGYPLYLLLGRTFASLVPFGEVAWRYNVLSALFGAGAIGFIVALIHRLVSAGENGAAYSSAGQKRYRLLSAGGAGALLAGFSYFSSQSTIAEVYALNALMLSSLLYSAVAWHQSGSAESDSAQSADTGGDLRWAYTCAALAGLALNAHLSCVFLAPGILLYVLAQHRARFVAQGGFFRHLLRMAALFCAAYALTLYLPLRAAAFPPVSAHDLAHSSWPPLDWTHPATFKQWLAHITAKQYKHLLWQPYEVSLAGLTFHVTWFIQPLAKSLSKFSTFSLFVLIQFFWSVPFLFVGAWTCWNNGSGARQAAGGRWLGLLLTLSLLFNVALEINYTVGDMQNFFFPAYMVMAVWLGLGISRTLSFIEQRITPPADAPVEASPKVRRGLTPLQRVTTLVMLWIASSVFLQWSWSGSTIMQRGDTGARDHALRRADVVEELYRTSGLAPNVVLMNDDALWTFWYARYVLGRAPYCSTPWGPYRNEMFDAGKMIDMVEKWKESGPVIMTKWDESLDRKHPYDMLSDDGDLCLISDRVLPRAAMPVRELPHGSPLWNVEQAFFYGELKPNPQEPENKGRYPHVQRSDMAAFTVNFSLRSAQPLSHAEAGGPTVDLGSAGSSVPSMHVGYIEVYMSLNGRHKTIKPNQPDERLDAAMGPPIVAWRQTRRLIVPDMFRQYRSEIALLQTSLPLQVDADARLGHYNVWVRLTRSRNDDHTPWTRVDDVILR